MNKIFLLLKEKRGINQVNVNFGLYYYYYYGYYDIIAITKFFGKSSKQLSKDLFLFHSIK